LMYDLGYTVIVLSNYDRPSARIVFNRSNRSDIGNCGRKCPEWVIDN